MPSEFSVINTAVILAAGLGSRLKEKTAHKPKGFLKLENKSIIEKSIETLLNNGIKKIIIGTGYLSEFYENLQNKFTCIQCVKNNNFANTGSMFTLYNLRKYINMPFLLLESDLVYEPKAISATINTPYKNTILASGHTNSNDEVFIETDDKHFLINMSKNKTDLKNIYGELTGISKISVSAFETMCKVFEKMNNPKMNYEFVMTKSRNHSTKFFVKKIPDLIWCEIDDENHLQRAITHILPKLEGIKNET